MYKYDGHASLIMVNYCLLSMYINARRLVTKHCMEYICVSYHYNYGLTKRLSDATKPDAVGLGAIQVLRNADGVGCLIFWKKALRRCNVQCYLHYEGVGGGPISRKIALRNT